MNLILLMKLAGVRTEPARGGIEGDPHGPLAVDVFGRCSGGRPSWEAAPPNLSRCFGQLDAARRRAVAIFLDEIIPSSRATTVPWQSTMSLMADEKNWQNPSSEARRSMPIQQPRTPVFTLYKRRIYKIYG